MAEFLLGDYNAASWLADAPEVAASLATIPLYGANLRLWLSWPKTTDERGRLRSGLAELAELTGATVWAPAEGGAVRVLPDSRDLGAVDRHGRPSVWEAYGPAPVSGFESDLDGRLVPSGGIVTTSYPGVPLVSVPPDRERVMVARYARLTPSPGQFRIDLTILVDGRAACRYQDGSLLAVSARELGQRLRAAGWSGAPVALLAETAPEHLDGVYQHLAELGRQLGVTVSLETIAQPKAPGASAPRLPSSGDALPPPESPPAESLPAESLPPDELAPTPGQTTLVTVPGPALSSSSAPLGSGRVKPDMHRRPPPGRVAAGGERQHLPPAPPTNGATAEREPRAFPGAAVSSALSRLDPDDPGDAAVMIDLATAVADHAAAARQLRSATQPEERLQITEALDEIALRIDSLTGPAAGALTASSVALR